MSRARANSETDGARQNYRDWIHQVFARYSIPLDLDRDVTKYLGTASVKSGSFFSSTALFYEITESEKAQHNSSSSSSNSSTCSSDEVSLDSHMTLPPKKRKRSQVIRHSVIFCLLDSNESYHEILESRQYYLFPREAIVASFNETNQVLVSFHLPKPRTKLEELATYGHHKRRLTDPGLQVPSMFNQPAHVINVRLEDVSKGLYNALKQNVSDFEKVYGKMMELMELHSKQLSAQKLDFAIDNVDEEDIKYENMITKNYNWNQDNDDDQNDRDYVEPTVTDPVIEPAPDKSATKKCLYCGSKSTPMWRRGPQGAGTLCNACGVKWKHGKILCGQAPSPKIEKKKKKPTKKSKQTKEIVNNTSYFAAGVDAVEAAAVLTLLRRSS